MARRYPSVIPACSVRRTVNGNWSMATPRSASGARSCLGRTSPLPLRGACELLRTPLRRRSEDLFHRPLVDSTYGRRDKTNRNNIRRGNGGSTARREHRLRGAQGADSPPFPEVGERHATFCADRARSWEGVPDLARLLQRLQRQVHGRGPRAPVLRGNTALVP